MGEPDWYLDLDLPWGIAVTARASFLRAGLGLDWGEARDQFHGGTNLAECRTDCFAGIAGRW